MKNFIKIAVLPAIILAFVGVSPAAADEPKVAEKAETKPEKPTVAERLDVVSLTPEEIYRGIIDIDVVLSSKMEEEKELVSAAPFMLKVVEEADRLDEGDAFTKKVGAALKRGVVARAAGIEEQELRLGTPRTGKAILRHTAGEKELEKLLNPSMWDKLKWWWNG